MQLTKNFALEEFACPCCGQMPDPENHEFKYFVGKLQEIRDLCRFPLHINSGFRCKQHNKDVGGVRDSSHLIGLAVDIEITNNFTRYLFLKSCFEVGIKRYEIARNYIHIDVDDSKDDMFMIK